MWLGQWRVRAHCLYKVSGTQLQDGLYITSVQLEDTGCYVCEAKNGAGSVESGGTLSIQGKWYTTTGWVIYLSSPASSWRIQASMCVSPKMWLGQWRVRAHCLYKVSVTQLQDELYIYSVQLEDTSSYVWEAKNVAGSVESESTLSIQGQWYTTIGTSVYHLISAGGYRQLCLWGQTCGWVSREWEHSVYTRLSGTQLQDGLYITSVQLEDTGSYMCEAKPVAGSVGSESTLSIQGKWNTTTGWSVHHLSPAGGYRQLCVWGQKCGRVSREWEHSVYTRYQLYTTTGWVIYLLSPAGGYRQLCVWGQKCGWVSQEWEHSVYTR